MPTCQHVWLYCWRLERRWSLSSPSSILKNMKKALVLCLCLAFMGVGCAPTSPRAATPSPAPPPTVKNLSESDKNTTVTLKTGDRIWVVLNSTYWEFSPPSSNVLMQVAEPVYAPDLKGHIPGSGAGTVTVEYLVANAGTALISASRTSCGEALLCTGDQGSYAVTVQATANDK